MLDQERQYYNEHVSEWLARFPGKFVLVKGQGLIGTFDTMNEALAEGARHFGLDSFLVRRVGATTEEVMIPALTLGLLRADTSHTDNSSN